MKEEAATSSFDNPKCLKKDKYMIILNDKKGNNFFIKTFEKYSSMLNNPYMECPCCHSNNLIKWGSYTRNICYVDNNTLKSKIINIKRVKCKDCNHTHALLPSFIVPYKINLLDVILHSLNNNEIAITISYDVIDKWNKQFNKHLPYLKTMFNNIKKDLIIKYFLQDIHHYYYLFFKCYKKILMMTRSGTVGVASF